MPELPEVEWGRRLLARAAVGRRIAAVEAAPDPIVFEGVPPARLRRALAGARVLAARRKGKHLWLELDRRPWPVLHFGMTGGLHVPARPGLRLRSRGDAAPPAGWPPRFTRLVLHVEGGGAVAFADARRLGRVRLRQDPAAEPPVRDLGFDALAELPPPARFRALLAARRTALKALLLDQSFAAGVGNWIADEVLYQARLDPRRPAADLDAAEAGRLRQALSHVIGTAVRLGADGDRFPRHWLFHVRWDRPPRGGVLRTPRGEPIRLATIGGRTTAWAPSVQR
jgi:formamidopyrimidine-DNA glycosylase